MLALLVLAGVSLVLVSLLAYPYRVALNGELRGEPDGSWAGAGGVEFGPVALTMAGARGVPAFIQIHAFGLRLLSRRMSESSAREPKKPRSSTFLGLGMDPYELGVTLLRSLERLRPVLLDLGLRYSFRNVVLTGQVSGALHALSALLPAGVRLSQQPGWEAVDRFAVSLLGSARASPLLFLYDGVCYMIRMHRKERAKKRAVVGARLSAEGEGRS
jgi:hypothetical protein